MPKNGGKSCSNVNESYKRRFYYKYENEDMLQTKVNKMIEKNMKAARP